MMANTFQDRSSARTPFMGRRAVTLVEILLAVTISIAVLSSAYIAYLQISRATEDSKAYSRAHNRGRAAVEEIGRTVAELRLDAGLAQQQFVLTTVPLAYGDRVDQDRDGTLDEEILNGRDDDGDWTGAIHDLHQIFPGISFVERPGLRGFPDHGDLRVDQDVVFCQDILTFRLPASIPLALPSRLVRYRVIDYNGRSNVLVRETIENPPDSTDLDAIYIAAEAGGPVTTTPVAFEVVSLDVIAWDPNENFDDPRPFPYNRPYWVEDWDASVIPGSNRIPYGALPFIPPFDFPAALLIRVTVNAETRPLSELQDLATRQEPLRTAKIQTVVDLPVTTQTAFYDLFVRPFVP
jgi:hypothetical protein